MKKANGVLCFAFVLLGFPSTCQAQSIAGDWKGNLTAELPVVLHVATNGSAYSATADSPKQNAFGMPATFTVDGDKVSFTIVLPGNPASFDGIMNGNTFSGTFHQGAALRP